MKYFLCLLLLITNGAYADDREKKHVAIFQLVSGQSMDPIHVRNAARQVENYYRYYARDVWDVRVEGFQVETDCEPLAPYYCKQAILEWIATHDMHGFEPNYFHVWGGYSPSYCGQANIYDNWGVTYNIATCGYNVMIHELGHNFGWHHAGTLDEITGVVTEYGDHYGVMGGSWQGAMLLSPNLIRAGLVQSVTIQENVQLSIAPVEVGDVSLYPEDTQHHLVLGGRHFYTISLHRGAGNGIANRHPPEEVLVHQTRPDGRTKLVISMAPGTRYTLPNGVVIDYLKYTRRRRARVNVLVDPDGPLPENIPETSREFPPHPDGYISEEHNGAWYDPDFDGQGFDFQIKGDRVVVYWYTYNVRSADRRWYYGTCRISECQEGFALHTTQKGTFDDPTIAERMEVGRAAFSFSAADKGVFHYDTEEFGIGAVNLTLLARGKHALNGAWYNPELDGAGFSAQMFGDLLVMYWFTYGSRDYMRLGEARLDTQRWYFLAGEVSATGEYTMTIWEGTTGKWMWFSDPSLVQAGTARVIPTGDGLEVHYDLRAGRNAVTGVYQLERLF